MMTTQDILKKRFNIQILGQGKTPMMFVHGFGCDQAMWRFVTPQFEQEYQVILLDLMGAGQSNISDYKPERYMSLMGYASDVLEIAQAFHLNNLIFVGHSVSAVIGILAAIQKPEKFDQLVLIGPSPCYFNDGSYHGGFPKEALVSMLENADKDYLGWARSLAPVIMARPDRMDFQDELTNSFCRTNPEIARQFARVLFLSDHRSELSKVETPSLILQCSQDIVAPETVGRYMHEKMKNSHFHQLKAVGHCPHVSEPEETCAAIQRYLKEEMNKHSQKRSSGF